VTHPARSRFLAVSLALMTAHAVAAEDRILEDSFESLHAWKLSALCAAVIAKDGGVMRQGTLDLNNPLRRELAQPFRGAELFVRFQFRYDPPEDDGEFFVMWLDRLDGMDVADAGPKKGKTVFIVRIDSAKTAWSTVEMQRGGTYSVVGRLSVLRATLLHALGLDQHRLIYGHHNRDEIPTVFGGEVVREFFS